jgi:hypothetical protein
MLSFAHPAGHLYIKHLVCGTGIPANDIGTNPLPFGRTVGVSDIYGGQAVVQPCQMLGQAERSVIIDRYYLIDPVSEQKTPVKDRDFRLLPGQELTIKKYAHYALLK